MKKVVFTFGRMNPPTVGHQKLVQKVEAVAKQQNADARVYLSHSQNNKKDPLDYTTKVAYATKAFGKVITKTNAKTIIQVMKELQVAGYTDVTLVVGSDRISEFKKLLTKYNGKDYTFNSINFTSAGQRDPDAEGVEGMSASKMRALAVEGDFASFKTGLPKGLQSMAKEIYNKLRNIMEEEDKQVDEALNLQQRQKRSRLMKRLSKRIARKREIARKRMADSKKLQKRSLKKARALVRKKLMGKKGENYANLSAGEKITIDKMVDKKQPLIAKLAKRLMPKIRRAEVERLRKARSSIKETIEPNLDAVKQSIAKEKQRDKQKWDRMRDSARIRDAIQKNKQEEAIKTKAESVGMKYTDLMKIFEQGVKEYDDNKVGSPEQQAFNKVNHVVAEAKKEDDLKDACWKGYKAVGLKDKNGKKVPNCVPEENGKEETKLDEVDTNAIRAKVQAAADAKRKSEAAKAQKQRELRARMSQSRNEELDLDEIKNVDIKMDRAAKKLVADMKKQGKKPDAIRKALGVNFPSLDASKYCMKEGTAKRYSQIKKAFAKLDRERRAPNSAAAKAAKRDMRGDSHLGTRIKRDSYDDDDWVILDKNNKPIGYRINQKNNGNDHKPTVSAGRTAMQIGDAIRKGYIKEEVEVNEDLASHARAFRKAGHKVTKNSDGSYNVNTGLHDKGHSGAAIVHKTVTGKPKDWKKKPTDKGSRPDYHNHKSSGNGYKAHTTVSAFGGHVTRISEEVELQIDEALEVKLRGGKVPVGQHRFKYDVDKSDKYIENSIKARDKDAKVERKGKDLWVTASAQAHSSVIASMRKFSVAGTISEEYGCEGEAKSKSVKNHKKKMLKDILPKSGGGQIGTDELLKNYKKDTPGQTTEMYCPETGELKEELIVEAAEYQGKKVSLNDPFRLPAGSKKKFGVYVKNDKGNVVKVQFGDPNMEIKRDDPERRKAFRSRHSCDDDIGPKWKARYWSCYQWRAGKKVDN